LFYFRKSKGLPIPEKAKVCLAHLRMKPGSENVPKNHAESLLLA
jgi:hypothetical protein